MSVRDTSKAAYLEVSPKLGQRQKVVLDAIRRARREVNNQEIANFLGVPINTITPRTNELVSMGRVELAGKYVYPATRRTVCYWRAVRQSM